MRKKGFLSLLLVLLGLFFTSSWTLAQTVKIGIELPLTGYGAIYGEDGKRAVELAVEEVNATGGINGKKVEAIFEDDGGVGKTAVAATQKLVTVDKVQVIIGGMMSSAALPAAPLAKENKVVFLSTISSHPELTGPGGYIYRIHTTDRVNANAAGKFATKVLKLRRGAGLAATSDYGRSLIKFTQASFEKEGGTWLITEDFAQGSNDFRSQLTKIKEKSPEVLFIAATVREAAQMIRQMVELRMKMPVIGSSMLDDPALVTLTGEAADMVYYHRVYAAGEEGKKREEAFNERYKAKFPGKEPAIAAKYYYDGIGLVCAAMKSGGETGPGIDQGMRKIKDYPGLTGNITFDRIGDRIFTAAIIKIDKGKPVETGFTNSD